MFAANELEKKAIEEAIEVEYEGIKTNLTALFLRADREKDRRKIQILLAQAEIDEIELYKILTNYGVMTQPQKI